MEVAGGCSFTLSLKRGGNPENTANYTMTTNLAKLVSFTIIWNEGRVSFEGKVLTTWKAVHDVLKRIYEPGETGYNKVKACIITGREVKRCSLMW